MIYDREEIEVQEVTEIQAVGNRTKLTADRLVKVEQAQNKIGECRLLLDALATEEEGGWLPGQPRSGVSHRVEPLEMLARQMGQAVEELERLYS